MDYLDLAADVVKSAIKAGADQAEVYIQAGDEFGVNVREGRVETLTQASFKGLGLRIFVDQRMAFAGTTDIRPAVLSDLIKTTVQLARAANRDRYNGLPDAGPGTLTPVDLCDRSIAELSVESRIDMAKAAEQSAFAFDPRITTSYGAGFGDSAGSRVIANSNGVAYTYCSTNCSISAAPVAEQDGAKQYGVAYSSRRYLGELEPPGDIGREAAVRAVRKLGARPVETQRVPVVFDWSVADDLWGPVFSALDGDTARRGMSFLKKMVGKRVASPLVNIIDDPLMPGGVGSMPFDGEGVLSTRKVVIENGVLKMYFYDARTARKYGKKPTGNARRGYSTVPHVAPTNFYLKTMDATREDIIRGIKNGFYVTETIGSGANVVTGDFSVGATGMWIRDGELAFPVQEVTIAGNMLDMMRNVEQIANDIRFISSIVSPTFKVAEMMVGGR